MSMGPASSNSNLKYGRLSLRELDRGIGFQPVENTRGNDRLEAYPTNVSRLRSGHAPNIVARAIVSSLALLFALSTVGCCIPGRAKWNLFPCEPKCVLSPNPTKRELVRHINANADHLKSWRSTNASVSITGMPFPVSASVAVERPLNLRLIASSVRGDEADLGSNDERLWFWVKESKTPRVVTVKHEDLPHVSNRMPIPFQPEWLIDAFGVVPLKESDVELEMTDPENRLATLTGVIESPDGKRIRRVIEVDTCMGHVRKHLFYDAEGRLIASARMNKHKSVDGLFVPRSITLDWPDAHMRMELTLGRIEVNPVDASRSAWEVPRIANNPVMDLGHFVPPAVRHARALAAKDRGQDRVVQAEHENGSGQIHSVRQVAGIREIPDDGVGVVSPGDASDEPPWADVEDAPFATSRDELNAGADTTTRDVGSSAIRDDQVWVGKQQSDEENPFETKPPGSSVSTGQLAEEEVNPFERLDRPSASTSPGAESTGKKMTFDDGWTNRN